MSKIEEIKEQIDIVDIIGQHLGLSKKGQNYWAMCPFHDDSNPSMSISPDKQIFKCFVCGAGGDAISFVSKYEKIPFAQAMSKLAKNTSVEYKSFKPTKPKYDTSKQKLINVIKDASLFFQNAILTDIGAPALEYVTNRGISQEVINKFEIGYAPPGRMLIDFLKRKGHEEATMINASLLTSSGMPFQRDRLIFPIKNQHGDTVAFSGRTLDPSAQAKYINSAESSIFNKSQTLYNYTNAKESMTYEKQIYVLEGFMDVIALSRVGVNNAVAIMGTALTQHHLPLFKNNEVTMMLDGDKAGIAATIKSLQTLIDYPAKVSVINDTFGKDADELLSESPEKLREVLKDKITAIEFVIKLHDQKYHDITPESNQEYLSSIVKYFKNSSSVEKDFYINTISQKRNISKEIVSNAISPQKQQPLPPPSSPTTYPHGPSKYIHTQRNYEFELVHSLLVRSDLIDIIEQKKPPIKDPIIDELVDYMIEYKRSGPKQPLPEEFKQKIIDIKNNSKGVKTLKGFQMILDLLENEHEKQLLKIEVEEQLKLPLKTFPSSPKKKIENNTKKYVPKKQYYASKRYKDKFKK